MDRKRLVLCAALALAVVLPVRAVEWQTVESKKFGYSMKIPAQFKMEGSETETTTWIYQPGSAAPAAAPAAEAKEEGKGKKLGGKIGGLLGGKKKDAAAPADSGGGGLQPALSIYVNWVWMPDVSSSTMYSTNKKGDQQDIDSPSPHYKEIVDFDKKKGYAYDGNTYWYKEADKAKGDEIHRWHIKSAGNKSFYTVGLCGTYEQFKEWAPIYEEVIKSWKLIPLEKK